MAPGLTMSLTFLMVAILYTRKVTTEPGICVMRCPCPHDSNWDIQNCAATRKAAPLSDTTTYQLLSKTCPHLFAQGARSSVCCSPAQVLRLVESLEIPSVLLSSCPACFENFKKIFCDLACSPDQEDFVRITKVENNGHGDVIKEVSYYMDKTFAENTFRSCQNVRGFTTITTAMTLMCGPWGGSDCTAQRWLDFLGLSVDNGGLSPYQVNYRLVAGKTTLPDGKQVVPLTRRALSCSEAAGPENKRCSCADCNELTCG